MKINKLRTVLSLVGFVGVTSLVAPILVSCGDSKIKVVVTQVGGFKQNIINKLSIWEINSIASWDQNWKTKPNIKILRKAFSWNPFDTKMVNQIKSIEVSSDFIVTLNIELPVEGVKSTKNIKTHPLSSSQVRTSKVITEKETIKYFAAGGIWAGKTTIGEAELKGTTEIGNSAFKDNPIRFKLESLVIPNSVRTIGAGAFISNGDSLAIKIPDSVTTIGESAFADNIFLNNQLIIPDSVTYIGADAFRWCGLTEVTLSKNTQIIGAGSFNDNKLTSISFPDSLLEIGKDAFASGNKLDSIIIPDKVTSVGMGAFAGNKLTSVKIGKSVSSIGESAFKNNELTSINIPDSVVMFNKWSFIGNKFKKTLDINISDKNLGIICNWTNSSNTVKENFEEIFGIKYYLNTFGDIKIKATNDLSIWEIIALADDKKNWTAPLLSKAFDDIDASNIGSVKNLEIKDNGVITLTDSTGTAIISNASTNTKTTVLTKTMTDEFFAAGGIWDGKTIFGEADLKDTTEIGANTFENKNLTSVTIPNTVTVIGKNAFKGNQLTTVSIPDSVKIIASGAFTGNKFKTYQDIEMNDSLLNSTCTWAENYNTVRENFELIFGVEYPGFIAVKKEFLIDPWTLNAYNNGTPIPSTVEFLSTAFYGIDDSNITKISNIRMIFDNQITITYNGKDITSATPTLSTTVLTKELVDKFFATGGIWAGKITIVEVDLKGTTEIGANAFENKNLTSVTIPNTVTVIGKGAFIGNSFKTFEDIKITPNLLNSICTWNNKTVKENFVEIFGVEYPKK